MVTLVFHWTFCFVQECSGGDKTIEKEVATRGTMKKQRIAISEDLDGIIDVDDDVDSPIALAPDADDHSDEVSTQDATL